MEGFGEAKPPQTALFPPDPAAQPPDRAGKEESLEAHRPPNLPLELRLHKT